METAWRPNCIWFDIFYVVNVFYKWTCLIDWRLLLLLAHLCLFWSGIICWISVNWWCIYMVIYVKIIDACNSQIVHFCCSWTRWHELRPQESSSEICWLHYRLRLLFSSTLNLTFAIIFTEKNTFVCILHEIQYSVSKVSNLYSARVLLSK